ncbi:hormogonium polysaccharide secretion pseudopilin HpsC [Coleofasciculus chthonoplastes]|uniref:hormogonium polysaccharide secretion pseudopilin HpsC n=1 Tax=Coleofasciculus chthonoplastes TaxID=64178 RepID=UPI0032FDA8E2
MINPLKFRLINQLQHHKQGQTPKGFTLIELLVAIILAALVITPLLGFMINILSTDRKEQAKATSEQEIKAALDYMAQDLQQAVYIYNADSLTRTSAQNPPGIKDQLPPEVTTGVNGCSVSGSDTCEPILVFWKRELEKNAIPVTGCTASPTKDCKDDTYVYSLVGYYLISGNNTGNTWSDVARIARFEISDGVIDPAQPTQNNEPNYITNHSPDGGFAPFSLSGSGDLNLKMNRWTKSSTNYNVSFGNTVLADYIDNTSVALSTASSAISCDTANGEQMVPKPPTPPTAKGFYACVNSQENYARLYLRGNAKARLQTNNIAYNANNSTFFPTATMQVEGRGTLFTR